MVSPCIPWHFRCPVNNKNVYNACQSGIGVWGASLSSPVYLAANVVPQHSDVMGQHSTLQNDDLC